MLTAPTHLLKSAHKKSVNKGVFLVPPITYKFCDWGFIQLLHIFVHNILDLSYLEALKDSLEIVGVGLKLSNHSVRYCTVMASGLILKLKWEVRAVCPYVTQKKAVGLTTIVTFTSLKNCC